MNKHAWVATLERPIQEYSNYTVDPALRLRVVDNPKAGQAVYIRLKSDSLSAQGDPCKMMRVYRLKGGDPRTPTFHLTDVRPPSGLAWEFRDFGWFLYEVVTQTTGDLQRLIKSAKTPADYQVVFDLFDEKIFEMASRPAKSDELYEKAMKCVARAVGSSFENERQISFRAACRFLNQIILGGTP